jgi:two-component system cell cycle sensor histidine kinase/response regulator CckA
MTVSAGRGDTAAQAGTVRVLLMDDDEDFRVLTRIRLEKLGFVAVLASDGRSAIEAYRQARLQGQPFGTVILDLTLPGSMGGREVLEALRRIDPDVRAWLTTGYAYDPMVTECLALGFQGILLKPFGVEELRRVLAMAARPAASSSDTEGTPATGRED